MVTVLPDSVAVRRRCRSSWGGAAGLVPVTDGRLDRRQAGHAAGREVGPVPLDPLHVPVLEGVFLDAGVVRDRGAVDEGRGVVAVPLDEARGQPAVHERDGDLLLGLRLHEEVAVRVDAGGVAAGAVHATVGVVVHEDDDDLVVEDLVDRGVDAPRRHREVADDLHVGVDGLVLVAVDVRLVDAHLDVVAVGGEELLRLDGAGQHQGADGLPAVVAAHLLRGLHGVDDDSVDVAALRGLSEDLVRHAGRNAGRGGLSLELVQQGLDVRPRHQRQRGALAAGDRRLSGLRGADRPRFSVGRPEALRDRLPVPRPDQSLRRSGQDQDEQDDQKRRHQPAATRPRLWVSALVTPSVPLFRTDPCGAPGTHSAFLPTPCRRESDREGRGSSL